MDAVDGEEKYYPKRDFLKLVHCTELFEPVEYSVVEWSIRSFSVFLNPRVIYRYNEYILISSEDNSLSYLVSGKSFGFEVLQMRLKSYENVIVRRISVLGEKIVNEVNF